MNSKAFMLLVPMLAGFLGGVLAAVVVLDPPLWAFAPSTAPRVVSANSFVLLDESGTVRGIWTATKEGATGLYMMRRNGQTVSGQFLVDAGGEPQLTLFDKQGKTVWVARPK